MEVPGIAKRCTTARSVNIVLKNNGRRGEISFGADPRSVGLEENERNGHSNRIFTDIVF